MPAHLEAHPEFARLAALAAATPIGRRPDILSTEKRWVVVQTNPRCEFRADLGLNHAGYGTLLPIETRMVRHGRHEAQSVRPLFPGYLFLSLPGGDDDYRIRRCDGVRDLLKRADGRLAIVGGDFMDDLACRTLRGEFNQVPKPGSPAWLKPGIQAQITAGPFAGFYADVLRARPKHRAEVLLRFLGRASRLEIEVEMLEPV